VAFARALLGQAVRFQREGNLRLRPRGRGRGPASDAALNEIWRKYVKNDALRLKLAGRTPEEIRKTLDKRYAQPRQAACTSCAATTCSRAS
jgi:carboxyl-terminal processing protease